MKLDALLLVVFDVLSLLPLKKFDVVRVLLEEELDENSENGLRSDLTCCEPVRKLVVQSSLA